MTVPSRSGHTRATARMIFAAAAAAGALAAPAAASAATVHGRPAGPAAGPAVAGCPHCTEYLAQMRRTIELTGTLTPDDLTPQMQDDFIDLYRQWRADGPTD